MTVPSSPTTGPGVSPRPPWRDEKAGPVGAGQEAQVLRVGLARDRQAGIGGDPSDLRLGQLAERKAHPRQRRRRKRREHVGLILGGVSRDAQQRPIWMIGLCDPRVMTGRKPGAAEAFGEVEHRVEADVAVAADARVRRLPGGEAGDERLDHAGPELRAQIDREVGQSHRVRERPRLRDRGG